MENQKNNTKVSQIEQFEEEAHQHTNLTASEKIKIVGENVAPIDTGSANIPGRDNDRELFVGGLTNETTEEDLNTYFTKYGPINSVKLKIDPNTQRSKGFAFIVFNSAEAITKVNAAGEHIINNKRVDAQLTKSKQGKVFVGGITSELSEDDIKNHFGQFGNVVKIQIPVDKMKNQRKNFCFVIFDSEDVVKNLLKTPKIFIKDVEVDVKKAIQNPQPGSSARDLTPSQHGRTGFARNFRQKPVPQSYTGQNYDQQNLDGQNWNSNQIYGRYGYGQQPYGNVYDGAVYNAGYQSAAPYTGYGGIENYASTTTPIRNNITGFTRGTGRGNIRGRAGRGASRGTTRGANNEGNFNGAGNFGGNFRHQPY